MVTSSSSYKFPTSKILVFARAPVISEVKTRLIPAIGAEAATELYQLMLDQTLATAVNSQLCDVQLQCTPTTQHPSFHEFSSTYPVKLLAQQGNDLGERMYNAAAEALKTCKSVVIIGSDCLQLSELVLGKTLAMLQKDQYKAVFAPAHDGGYTLIALKQAHRDLFENIDWGTGQVMEQTRQALSNLKWKWYELDTLRDVDTFDDLEHIHINKHQYTLSTGVRLFLQTTFNEQTQE